MSHTMEKGLRWPSGPNCVVWMRAVGPEERGEEEEEEQESVGYRMTEDKVWCQAGLLSEDEGRGTHREDLRVNSGREYLYTRREMLTEEALGYRSLNIREVERSKLDRMNWSDVVYGGQHSISGLSQSFIK